MNNSIKHGSGDRGSMRAADRIREKYKHGDDDVSYASLAGSLHGALSVMDALDMTPKEYVAEFIDGDGGHDA